MNLRIRFAIACLLASGVFGLFAMPVADELAAVKPLVSELMKPDMDALKAGKKSRADVAKSALSLATQAESSAAKLLLTRNAFNLYMKAGEYEPAEGALDAMLKAVPDYPADELQELLEKALYPVPNKKAPQLRARLAEVKTKAASAVQVKKLKALLEKTPEDPALNLRLGTTYALQNDWNNARSAFAKCSNADLAKAAKTELDLENPPAKVADLWWSIELPKKDPKLTASIRSHAADLYKSALPSLTGLTKVQAERRIGETKRKDLQIEKSGVKGGEWVYCSGGAFYLDTGIIPKDTMSIEWDVRFPEKYKGNRNFSGANCSGKGMCINTGTSNADVMEFYDVKWQNGADTSKCLLMDSSKRNCITWCSSGISVNGQLVVKSPLQTCMSSLVLFDRNRNGKPGGSSSECWVYGLKIRDGNRILLDYRPKQKGEIAGFWDKVSGRFITPSAGQLKFGKD